MKKKIKGIQYCTVNCWRGQHVGSESDEGRSRPVYMHKRTRPNIFSYYIFLETIPCRSIVLPMASRNSIAAMYTCAIIVLLHITTVQGQAATCSQPTDALNAPPNTELVEEFKGESYLSISGNFHFQVSQAFKNLTSQLHLPPCSCRHTKLYMWI